MRRPPSAVLMLVFVACGEVVPSTPDGSAQPDASSVDAPPSDIDASDMPDAAPVPLPRDSAGFMLEGALFEPNATVEAGTNGLGRVTVGAAGDSPGKRDGHILVRGLPSGPESWKIDGGSNDQLFAVAAAGASYAGVGFTRSFLGTLTRDQGLGVFALGDGSFEVRNYFIRTDEAILIRAVAPSGAGWAIAGNHQNAARGFVAILDASGIPLGAVTFLPDAGTSEVRVRRLIDTGNTLIVVGRANRGALRIGFLLAFDSTNLVPTQALAFEAPSGIELADAALDGMTIRVVGSTAENGVSFSIAPSGSVSDIVEWPGLPLSAVEPTPNGMYVAGTRGAEVFSGIVGDGELRAVTFVGLSNNAVSPDILVAGPASVAYYGERDGALIEVPLNTTPVGACDGQPFGSSLTMPASSSTVTSYVPTVDVRGLPLESTVQTTPVARVGVLDAEACAF